MILVGEKLNSSIPSTLNAMQSNDTEQLTALIKAQSEAGADYLDINTAMCTGKELEMMIKIIELSVQHSVCGIMIDTSNPAVMEKALTAAGKRNVILNSLTITDRFDEVSDLALKYNCSLVALPIAERMPHSLEDRCKNIDTIIEKLRQKGIPDDKIFVDTLTETLATDSENALACLKSIEYTAKNYPSVHTICGLSNVSFGLPVRKNINSSFMSMAVFCGLDSVIADVCSNALKTALISSLAVCGKDEYCMDYISHIRSMD